MFRSALRSALLAVVATLGLTGCHEVTAPRIDPPAPPPPAPTAVTPSMSATVDGEAWASVAPAALGDDKLGFYTYVPGLNMLVVGGMRAPSYPDTTDATCITIAAITPLEPCTIQLGGEGLGSATFWRAVPHEEWNTDDSRLGSLTLDSVDKGAGIIRGHFSFDAAQESGTTTMSVRGGAFVARLVVASTGTPTLALASAGSADFAPERAAARLLERDRGRPALR